MNTIIVIFITFFVMVFLILVFNIIFDNITGRIAFDFNNSVDNWIDPKRKNPIIPINFDSSLW